MTRLFAVSAAAIVAAMLGGLGYMMLSGPDDQFAACRSTQVAGGLEIGGPFTLVNSQGMTVTQDEVLTEPSIIYFGYTFCPDVCPFDAARNAEAVELLDERGISATPVFISVDPERDTPEVVDIFAANMHEKMIGLTGSPEQVRAASQAYRTYYRKADESDPDYYTVDHSTFSYLHLPGHGTVEIFNRDTTADQMAESAACFVGAAG